MTRGEPSAVVPDVGTLFGAGALGGLTDGQLLERFAAGRDGSAEAAFAILVERHGPMVWGVCRRILDDPHAAADAFQATFLILVRKAAVVRVDDSLGRWLYGVSRRVAVRARKTCDRRQATEGHRLEDAVDHAPDPNRDELLKALDGEIARLPERYRAAIVLCDLGGVAHEEAARLLGCAVGTIGSRLSRGRQRLRTRLVRRGLLPSVAAMELVLSGGASPAPLPRPLVDQTCRAAVQSAGGWSTAATVLTEEILRAMVMNRLKTAAVATLVVSLATGGVVLSRRAAWGQRTAPPAAESRLVGQSKPREAAAATASGDRRAQARVDVARKICDAMRRTWQGGEIEVDRFLEWQRRYHVVVLEVEAGSRAERIHFLESEVRGLKKLETDVRQLNKRGHAREIDASVVEYYRLEAEELLERAQVGADNGSSEKKPTETAPAPSLR